MLMLSISSAILGSAYARNAGGRGAGPGGQPPVRRARPSLARTTAIIGGELTLALAVPIEQEAGRIGGGEDEGVQQPTCPSPWYEGVTKQVKDATQARDGVSLRH